MVSRSLTEVFVLMRNNAIHSRHIFSEQDNDTERMRLMRRSSRDAEGGLEGPSPPPWTDTLEEAHYVISRVRTKLSELQSRQEQQLRRPALDDDEGGGASGAAGAGGAGRGGAVARLAADLARLFTHAHAHLAHIRRYATQGTKTERQLVTNVVLALVTILQDLSITFRTAQSNYLKSLTSREERSNVFDLPNFEELSLDDDKLPGLTNNQTDMLFALPSTSGAHDFDNFDNFEERVQNNLTQTQLLLLQEENTKMVSEREDEVNKIVRSITDLNDVFKDLAHMVHEQGTVLDRIDFNIEQTQTQVHEGYKQLQKAERYQRSNRKMHCILILAVILIIMVFLLVIVKS